MPPRKRKRHAGVKRARSPTPPPTPRCSPRAQRGLAWLALTENEETDRATLTRALVNFCRKGGTCDTATAAEIGDILCALRELHFDWSATSRHDPWTNSRTAALIEMCDQTAAFPDQSKGVAIVCEFVRQLTPADIDWTGVCIETEDEEENETYLEGLTCMTPQMANGLSLFKTFTCVAPEACFAGARAYASAQLFARDYIRGDGSSCSLAAFQWLLDRALASHLAFDFCYIDSSGTLWTLHSSLVSSSLRGLPIMSRVYTLLDMVDAWHGKAQALLKTRMAAVDRVAPFPPELLDLVSGYSLAPLTGY
jgi:hypothetical protein